MEGERFRAGASVVEYRIEKWHRPMNYNPPCDKCAIKGTPFAECSCVYIRCSQATKFGYFVEVGKN